MAKETDRVTLVNLKGNVGVDNTLLTYAVFAGFQVRELDRRASGSAFQVILSPSNSTEAKAKILLSPVKKGLSLEEQKKKLAAADERRKVLVNVGILNDAGDWCGASGSGN